MTKDCEKLFQERIDELLLLEQRADRHAEKFIEITNDYQKESKEALDNLLGKVGDTDESLAKMNAASDSVNNYITFSAKHATNTLRLFMSTIIITMIIVAGTLWRPYHINSSLADAKDKLASLNTKLKHTPVIVHFHHKDYVRAAEDSEISFKRRDGGEVAGRYSEVWHIR